MSLKSLLRSYKGFQSRKLAYIPLGLRGLSVLGIKAMKEVVTTVVSLALEWNSLTKSMIATLRISQHSLKKLRLNSFDPELLPLALDHTNSLKRNFKRVYILNRQLFEINTYYLRSLSRRFVKQTLKEVFNRHPNFLHLIFPWALKRFLASILIWTKRSLELEELIETIWSNSLIFKTVLSNFRFQIFKLSSILSIFLTE